jgi:hypothetical protein
MAVVHDHVGEAGERQALDLPLDERAPAGAQQRLGHGVGERAHALATAGRKDEGAVHQNVGLLIVIGCLLAAEVVLLAVLR